MATYFLGVDIGCGGAKACIIDDNGRLVGYGFSEHAITVSHGAWSETDPDEYWGNIARITGEIIASNNLDPKQVRAISVSSAVPATVMIDREGKVINKAYNFLDTRAVDVARRLKDQVGKNAASSCAASTSAASGSSPACFGKRKTGPMIIAGSGKF